MSFCQADLGPRSAQIFFFFFFFRFIEKFEKSFSKISPHSERYRNILAGMFEILAFYGNVAFPLSPVLVPEDIYFWCCVRTVPAKPFGQGKAS